MKILFLPFITGKAALGTISRCLTIAEELRNLGHDAFFVTSRYISSYVREAGFEYLEAVAPEPPSARRPIRTIVDVALFLNLTEETFIHRSFEAELNAIEKFRPDVLFSEFKLTASISATRYSLPLVSTASTPAHPAFASPLFCETDISQETGTEGFNRLLSTEGLEPVSNVADLFFLRSHIKIVPSTPELEPMLSRERNLHYVGYLLYDRWEKAPLPPDLLKKVTSPRLVFAYLAVGEIGPDRYVETFSKAFDNTEFHMVMAVGSHPGLTGLPKNTANVTYADFVPGTILEKSAAVIFHGGQNTLMASLLEGVPGLVIPGTDFERDFNARGMAAIGAGIHMKADDFTPARVRTATRELLNKDFGSKARMHGSQLRALGGPARAAELVLTAL